VEQEKYLVTGPITGELIASLVAGINIDREAGGHSLFLGQVRADEEDGRKVESIEYTAYSSMVRAEADRIRNAVFTQFDDVRSVNILHSTGLVRAGEISLLVLISAGHREQAIQACRETVEMIKKFLPVWKKENYDDNTHLWSGGNGR
jgi:molybdopterin synthase catalytic subunit